MIFEKIVHFVGCVCPYAKGRTQCRALDCSTCDSSMCDTKVGKDDQQTKTTMVPATLTHIAAIAADPAKSTTRRLEEQCAQRKAKRESMHTISGR